MFSPFSTFLFFPPVCLFCLVTGLLVKGPVPIHLLAPTKEPNPSIPILVAIEESGELLHGDSKGHVSVAFQRSGSRHCSWFCQTCHGVFQKPPWRIHAESVFLMEVDRSHVRLCGADRARKEVRHLHHVEHQVR